MPLYEFHCTACDAWAEHLFKSEERPDQVECGHCTGLADYRVGMPAMFRVKFDQNGRVAYKYDMGNGKTQIRSATRERYEHNLGNRTTKDFKEMGQDKNRSVYTKQYDRHVRGAEKEKQQRVEKTLKEMAKSSK
jgi:putative FmdB family regulatory protein